MSITNFKGLAVLSLTTITLLGCASGLRTRQTASEARSSIDGVLGTNGFKVVNVVESPLTTRIVAESDVSFDLTERRYAVEQVPVTVLDPVNNNQTVFEERVNPAKYAETRRTETIHYTAEIRLQPSEPEREVTVSVTSSEIPVSNKYREIIWKGSEPLSARQIEEDLLDDLERAFTM